VTVVELREHILSLLLDNTASEIVEAAIRKKDVNIITGHSVQQIRGRDDDENKADAIILDNGEIISCDVVVIAVGVSPCNELVRGTKIETNRGIKIDRFMRTSVPDVYACGDVAEVYDFILSENHVLPQWPTAYSSGKIAGYNMAGISTQYPGGTVMSAMKYFDVPVVAMGTTNPKDGDEHQILTSSDPEASSYRKIVLKNGKIKGLILIGDIEKAGIFFHLMSESVNVEDFKEQLLSEDFGLISLPEQLRRTMISEV
jgi:NAD(P)H-nitrite reductase large subunit